MSEYYFRLSWGEEADYELLDPERRTYTWQLVDETEGRPGVSVTESIKELMIWAVNHHATIDRWTALIVLKGEMLGPDHDSEAVRIRPTEVVEQVSELTPLGILRLHQRYEEFGPGFEALMINRLAMELLPGFESGLEDL